MIYRRTDEGLEEVSGAALAALHHASPDGYELAPTGIAVVSGDKGGMPCRGLSLVAGGVKIVVMLPEEAAREVGRQLGDGGVIRA